jgi:hypothetical protein
LVDPTVSNIDGFLRRKIGLFPFTSMEFFGTMVMVLTHENTEWNAALHTTGNSILTGKQGARHFCL